MKKFEKVINEEGIGNVINGLIENTMGGDCRDYELGEVVVYKYDLDEYFEEICDYEVSINELKEFVGEGICLVDNVLSEIYNKEIWYNISVKDERLIIEFVADESIVEKI